MKVRKHTRKQLRRKIQASGGIYDQIWRNALIIKRLRPNKGTTVLDGFARIIEKDRIEKLKYIRVRT